MIILTDCLAEKIDEGCLKDANRLIKRIKSEYPDTTVVSYKQKTGLSDIHLDLNKLFLNSSLLSLIKEKNQPLLYIPFASNTTATALRMFVMSRAAKQKMQVIFAIRYPMNGFTKFLLKHSGFEVVSLSKESYDYFHDSIGRAKYLKTGIDTEKFVPIDAEQKALLRQKYDVAPDKKVLLHVGHLKYGRNVDKLLNVGDDYHVFMIASSVTENEKDDGLRQKLKSRPNTTVIESYLPNIQEIYQMSDVYLFPIVEEHNCIDVPLSVLEAAACDIPIVATKYGELKQFVGKPGFKFIDSFDKPTLNSAIDEAADIKNCNTREAVLEYDWARSVESLMNE